MADAIHYATFKTGSKTYFNSSVFFPRDVRDDVFVLYGFVRVADNYVDQIPQDAEGFREFCRAYRGAVRGVPSGRVIIDSYVELSERHGFPQGWTDAFLASMEMDLTKKEHRTLEESLEYIYGSAEVVGLFMSKILGLPEDAYPAAQMLGRAMQFINFIRDIAEDNQLGRIYLPLGESSLEDLSLQSAEASPEEFRSFISRQLDRYRQWQQEAERGYRYIPKRYLVPIKTAGDMYNWTAEIIATDPFIVYRRKVKPRRGRILAQVLRNALTL
ncbi:MAG: phytoene/squalene synthase family protein [Alkalispirochaetaceae bacterium]